MTQLIIRNPQAKKDLLALALLELDRTEAYIEQIVKDNPPFANTIEMTHGDKLKTLRNLVHSISFADEVHLSLSDFGFVLSPWDMTNRMQSFSDEFMAGFNLAKAAAAGCCERRAQVLEEHLSTSNPVESAQIFINGAISASRRSKQHILNLEPYK